MKLQTKQLRGGFTLIEIIVVIAILAILSAGGWVIKGVIDERKMVTTAELQIRKMSDGLNEYRNDNGGSLPYGKGDELSSHVLYRTLFSDTNNDGAPDEDENGNSRVYCDIIQPVLEDAAITEMTIRAIQAPVSGRLDGKKVRNKKLYVLMDPWGRPYRYKLGYEQKDEDDKEGPGDNPDFDLISLGPDMEGDAKDFINENEDNVTNIQKLK